MLTSAVQIAENYGLNLPEVFGEEPLTPNEIEVLETKLHIERLSAQIDGDFDVTASNKEIATELSVGREEPISRNEVARRRNSLRKKLGFKAGW